MADKISNFKKALRQAKASSNKSNQSKDAFGKELQKYNPPAKKELSPKQGDNKTDRKSNKQVPDKHSKTSGAPRSNANENKAIPKKRDSNEGRKESSDSALRLSTHARSSKLIQRKDQPTNSSKPAPQGTAKGDAAAKEGSQTETKDPDNRDKPLNFFKNITTSIHKHILKGEPQSLNTVTMNWEPKIEANNELFSGIIENARASTKGIEASMRMSDEVLHLTDVVGELLESETAAWKSNLDAERDTTPPSLFDPPTFVDKQAAKYHVKPRFNTSPFRSSPGMSDYNSLFIDEPFPPRKRSREWDDDSPQYFKAPKVHSSAPERTKALFDDYPSTDFFGFSHSQEGFSDFPHKKLFSNNFI